MQRIILSLIIVAAVAAAEDDPITKYIASLPWHGSYVTRPQYNKDIPDFIITVSYKREGIISDKEIIPLKLYPDSRARLRGQRNFKSRDSFGQGKWCNGTASVIEAGQDGFKIELELTWGGIDIPQETFKENIDCVWKTKQEFTKKDFHIIVETAKYNAEPTNAPCSSPAVGLKR